ncbi:unnamed protein product [Arabidopsis arenosa]|uniref:Phytocyanin domain-containing protein n=1 Tax=Arabidopsis arenosa TaxID=38785 RepID=A0A8S2AN99_ARAAE|nr:unnamed protein product [Arabidopsis arenosa]
MGFYWARKLLVILLVTAFVFSGSAEAWSWSWGSDQSGSNGGWGWSSGNSGGSSGSGSGGSDSNSDGSSWGWGWSSDGTDTNWGWGSSSGSHHSSGTGSTHNQWSSKHAPFYVNDVLVFKYNNNDQTQSKTKHHNKKKNDVYLLPDMKSFKRCDVARGKKLVARGGSSSRGFKLLLRKVQTYYFASGDHIGCNHNMKFSIHPIPHPSSH